MRELFVYYRVRELDAVSARATVLGMQADLSHPQLHARLLTRSEPDIGTQTWMETYALAAGPGIDADLQALIEASALPLARLIDGARHVEAFDTDAAT